MCGFRDGKKNPETIFPVLFQKMRAPAVSLQPALLFLKMRALYYRRIRIFVQQACGIRNGGSHKPAVFTVRFKRVVLSVDLRRTVDICRGDHHPASDAENLGFYQDIFRFFPVRRG